MKGEKIRERKVKIRAGLWASVVAAAGGLHEIGAEGHTVASYAGDDFASAVKGATEL